MKSRMTVLNINDILYRGDFIARKPGMIFEGLSLCTLFPFHLVTLDMMGMTDYYSRIKEICAGNNLNTYESVVKARENELALDSGLYASFLMAFKPGQWIPMGDSPHRRTSVQVNFLSPHRYGTIEIDVDTMKEEERLACVKRLHELLDGVNQYLSLIDAKCLFQKNGEIGVRYSPENVLIGLALLEKRGIHWNTSFNKTIDSFRNVSFVRSLYE